MIQRIARAPMPGWIDRRSFTMANERQEMIEKSATLYFGPWYRKSPFFEATRRAGCTAYDIYNHMYLPGYFDDPETEYWLLNDGVDRKSTRLNSSHGYISYAVFCLKKKKKQQKDKITKSSIQH